jgi:hypothetical protein
MSHLQQHDACPNCWHHPGLNNDNDGIGTFRIDNLITYTGGTLDNSKTCTQCQWNFELVRTCQDCQPNQPCPTHYASGYNGLFNAHMPLEMHRLYMRNSPYRKTWSSRPCSIGAWYAQQATSYEEAIHIAKRFIYIATGFATYYAVQMAFNELEHRLKHSVNPYCEFWQSFHSICLAYFSGSDVISTAMNSYYQTLRANYVNLRVWNCK